MINKDKKTYVLSASLKNNLKLRKKQISERDKNEIIGKRLSKIGVSKLEIKDQLK